MAKATFRIYGTDEDGISSCVCEVCDGSFGVPSTYVTNWESEECYLKFCMLCGTRVKLRKTRPHYFPRWAWDRGIEDFYASNSPQKPAFRIQTRNLEIVNGEWRRAEKEKWVTEDTAYNRYTCLKCLKFWKTYTPLFTPIEYRISYGIRDEGVIIQKDTWILWPKTDTYKKFMHVVQT